MKLSSQLRATTCLYSRDISEAQAVVETLGVTTSAIREAQLHFEVRDNETPTDPQRPSK